MTFPDDYPFNPPTFRFNNEFYHPNGKFSWLDFMYFHYLHTKLRLLLKVYPDGRLCISILHPPGEDPVSGEKAEVRHYIQMDIEILSKHFTFNYLRNVGIQHR